MLNFNAGAVRPANDDARAKRIGAANDLVRRTLAQHGLMPGAETPPAPGSDSLMKTISDALSRSGINAGQTPAPTLRLPEGAEFRSDTFKGHSGSRAYRTYVPASADQGVTGIVMMLHGCTQNPEDFATGTGMNALAEQHRVVVIYPEQSRGANAQSCWNWFSKGDQRRARGEPEILAGIAQRAMTEHGVSREHTFVAGLSAGAAMAVILGEVYPDVFAAIGVHSGLPFGAASDVPSAFAAMAGNAAPGPAPQNSDVRTIIFHGSADSTVHPSNGEKILQQAEARGPAQSYQSTDPGQSGGRGFRRSVNTGDDGTILSEHWVIDGLGHAWSGGQPGGSYTDPAGPDASAEMVRFFLDPHNGSA